ncbi:mannitol dehydrogenase family protein [Swaminathania salitolerans]|uniref:Mannitol dehydrogenase n=1 Tax=Swaminathania salitolerans TaxID=182838 RepID=A0A511BR81_9PROT|nr:mannitol dehydrogenase family protein [Swaminathania salitolerans]GBQ12355.1 NADPH-dependent L-sorbose reductase [Swaminathania salitolerans LMG 21291]GEL02820.1 mannitol dehydrogenase [Swaminathania salitolerans]
MITRETLKTLPDGVAGPSYDLDDIKPGIVHFGVGNFFRAHEAYYINKVLALPGQQDWGIIGVGLTFGERSRKKAEDFRKQDCLFSLTETAPSGESKRSINGALRDYLLASQGCETVLERLSDPSIRIVSMTITEGGYNIDEKTEEFDLGNEAVRKDLANPGEPATVFGYVVEALRRRRDAGHKAFTIMSCDNLRHNGNVARKAFLGYARARDPELAKWIEENATFPNAMVDRITPTVSPAIAERLNRESGLDDLLPLVAEDFTQWVIEDDFADGRPDLEKVGVQMVDDVTDYEYMKIRMLNASHIFLAFSGLLLGYEHIDESISDPDLRKLVETYLDTDVIPTLKAAPGEDLQEYKKSVISRFSNPAMADQNLRIGSDGASKVQVFWTATIRNLLSDGRDLDRVAYGLAAYLEMLRGKNEKGESYEPIEPTFTDATWKTARSDDFETALSLPAFDGWQNLDHAELDAKVIELRKIIREKGVKAALPV